MSDNHTQSNGDARRERAPSWRPRVKWRGAQTPEPMTPAPHPAPDDSERNSLRVDLGPLPFDDPNTPEIEGPPYAPLPFDMEPTPYEERYPPLPFDGTLAAHAADEDEKPAPAPRLKEIKPVVTRRPVRRSRFGWQDILALLFLLLAIGAVYVGLTIYRNPYVWINPLPPPTPLPIFVTATPGDEQPVLLPIQPDNPAVEATMTFTPLPADLLTELAPTALPSPTAEEATVEPGV